MTATGTRRPGRPPLDPRLVQEVRAARVHLAVQSAAGLIQAAAMIVAALALGRLGAALLADDVLPWQRPGALAALVLALGVRAVATFVQQRTAHRAATAAIAELRQRVVRHAALLGPRTGAGRGADVAALATTGIEGLRPYLAGYVPQLVLAATVTPLCLAAVAVLDPTSALLAAISLPLIPIFMVLIGHLTEGRSERLLHDMRTLWTQLLDLVEGLPTLRALGRERGPERTVAALGERHRRSAMGTLRYAFLSSMVLELLATLGVALVAVSIGLRLVAGEMALAPAVSVLVLAPEVYLPLRQVGQQFHASSDGLAALDSAFAVLDEPLLPDGAREAPDLSRARLALREVSARSRDGLAPAGLDIEVAPGRVLALVGRSGAGKTTAVHCLLGLLSPTRGRAVAVESDGADERELDVLELRRSSLWSQIAYLPQRPAVGPGTIRAIVTEARPSASDSEIADAAAATGLDRVVAERGWESVVGRGGEGLSLGERQRVALTRAVLSPAPVVILDEPTAHLDGASERTLVDLIRGWRDAGRAVLLVAHRSSLVSVADEVVEVAAVRDGAAVVEPEAAP